MRCRGSHILHLQIKVLSLPLQIVIITRHQYFSPRAQVNIPPFKRFLQRLLQQTNLIFQLAILIKQTSIFDRQSVCQFIPSVQLSQLQYHMVSEVLMSSQHLRDLGAGVTARLGRWLGSFAQVFFVCACLSRSEMMLGLGLRSCLRIWRLCLMFVQVGVSLGVDGDTGLCLFYESPIGRFCLSLGAEAGAFGDWGEAFVSACVRAFEELAYSFELGLFEVLGGVLVFEFQSDLGFLLCESLQILFELFLLFIQTWVVFDCFGDAVFLASFLLWNS